LVIIRGGTASNVVPEEATAEVDLRVINPAKPMALSLALQALKPHLGWNHYQGKRWVNRPPMPFNEMMKATFEKARKIAAGIGMELKPAGLAVHLTQFCRPAGYSVLDGLG